jgi:NhaP-type Na+/H+ and K+/H+ antiporter
MIPDKLPDSVENNDLVITSEGNIIKSIIADLRIVIDELDMNFANAKRLILELARRLDETKRCEQSQICRKIKEILQDKIKDGKITEKWIEGCLPQEYKRKYAKSELTSLSKQAKRNTALQKLKNRDQILVDAHQGQKSILTDMDSHNNDDGHKSNFHTHDSIEQGLNKEISNQNVRYEDDDQHDKHQALRSEIYELRQAPKRQTADKISAAKIELIIPKRKYEEVTSAMKSSKDSVYLTFDRSGILQRADSDIFRERK